MTGLPRLMLATCAAMALCACSGSTETTDAATSDAASDAPTSVVASEPATAEQQAAFDAAIECSALMEATVLHLQDSTRGASAEAAGAALRESEQRMNRVRALKLQAQGRGGPVGLTEEDVAMRHGERTMALGRERGDTPLPAYLDTLRQRADDCATALNS